MNLELWIAFVAASAALLAIPGPTITIVVGYALGSGRSAAWATVPGVVLGDFTAMTASLLGAGAVLATSATLFTCLKLAGAIYLVWLGVKLWRAKPRLNTEANSGAPQSKRSIFWNCFLVTALNPKDIMFFIAFVPQFINVSESVLPQLLILEFTFLAMVAANIALWTVSVGHLRSSIVTPRRMSLMNRIGGSFLIGAGVLTTAAR
ncbi:LysE family translocator [Roseibium sp. SCP14]|uniref:LysE family translocator n=1 Tax=Roseibium sp. SCP14 TaxID=3141375 RepID=UPI003339E885